MNASARQVIPLDGSSAPRVREAEVLVEAQIWTEVLSEEEQAIRDLVRRNLEDHATRRLVRSVERRLTERGAKSVAVVSLLPNEGRTFAAVLLARGLSEMFSARVLLVDGTGADLGSIPLRAAISENGPERSGNAVCRLLSFPASEMASLGRELGVGAVLKGVGAEYDFVVVDTQALTSRGSAGLDAVLVAEQVETTVVIFSKSSATPDGVRSVKELLGSSGRPCIGCLSRN